MSGKKMKTNEEILEDFKWTNRAIDFRTDILELMQKAREEVLATQYCLEGSLDQKTFPCNGIAVICTKHWKELKERAEKAEPESRIACDNFNKLFNEDKKRISELEGALKLIASCSCNSPLSCSKYQDNLCTTCLAKKALEGK